ncbi:MAG: hypothetical protein IJT22_00825 [Synergistaceae bacterium]|nr:hypothetical protein [Synergistaceae bacterium]MBQ9896788.1 hypothetical protein [Synergistaceae bacterium]
MQLKNFNLKNLNFKNLKKSGTELDNIEIMRVSQGELKEFIKPGNVKKSAPAIVLAPFKSLSVDAFAFPFSNSKKVREALKLQVMPYSAAGSVEIFPVVLEKIGRGAQGVVWYVNPEELSLPEYKGLESESDIGQEPTRVNNANNIVWPAPLPFVSALTDGTGVVLWADEENLCSILWQDYKPVLTRWRPRTRSTPEKEFAWFDVYCKDRELERGESFMFDALNINDASLKIISDIVRDSIAKCPWISSVNLSKSALEGAIGLERAVSLMTRVACWILFMGVIALAGSYLKLNQVNNRIAAVRAQSESLYKEVFEPGRTGRIANPLSLARDKLAELQRGGSEGRGFEDMLSDLGAIFTEDPSMDITVEILRYNSEGIDCTGSAPDMSTILTFRRAWESRASLAQLDNTQSVSGVGYRFDLRVRW